MIPAGGQIRTDAAFARAYKARPIDHYGTPAYTRAGPNWIYLRYILKNLLSEKNKNVVSGELHPSALLTEPPIYKTPYFISAL